jgi:hypothetical protein
MRPETRHLVQFPCFDLLVQLTLAPGVMLLATAMPATIFLSSHFWFLLRAVPVSYVAYTCRPAMTLMFTQVI